MALEIHHNLSHHVYRHYAAKLERLYDRREAEQLSREIILHHTGLPRVRWAAEREHRLSESEILGIHFDMKRLLEGEPLQYVTGCTTFRGLSLYTGPGVLIPRPETEELVEWVCHDAGTTPGLRVLDLCTGSGCVAVSLAIVLNQAGVSGTDLSARALEYAVRNSEKHQAGVIFFQDDLLHPDPRHYAEVWDIITVNPPYVRESEREAMHPNVRDYEPAEALFVPDEDALLFYRAAAMHGWEWLSGGGRLYAEINEALGEATAALFQELGYTGVVLRKDFYGRDRMLRATRP